jgi:hypothetical protein
MGGNLKYKISPREKSQTKKPFVLMGRNPPMLHWSTAAPNMHEHRHTASPFANMPIIIYTPYQQRKLTPCFDFPPSGENLNYKISLGEKSQN